MADNINSFNNDTEYSPLPIDEKRLKEIKAMEEAEQSLIEDLFSIHVNVKAQSNTIQVKQKNPTLPNQKKPKKKPK